MADERAAEQPDAGEREKAVSQPHDTYFQRVFANEQDAASLLRTCVPRPLSETLKWSTLSLVRGRFVADDWRRHETDLLSVTGAVAARVLQIAMMATFREAPEELLESVTRLLGELYRAKGFEEVAKHVEYVLATQPEAHRALFAEALRRNVPGRGGEVMNYVEEMIERGRREGHREGELKGQVRAIEGFVARAVPWSTIEAATGIDQATFRRLRQRIDTQETEGSPRYETAAASTVACVDQAAQAPFAAGVAPGGSSGSSGSMTSMPACRSCSARWLRISAVASMTRAGRTPVDSSYSRRLRSRRLWMVRPTLAAISTSMC